MHNELQASQGKMAIAQERHRMLRRHATAVIPSVQANNSAKNVTSVELLQTLVEILLERLQDVETRQHTSQRSHEAHASPKVDMHSTGIAELQMQAQYEQAVAELKLEFIDLHETPDSC